MEGQTESKPIVLFGVNTGRELKVLKAFFKSIFMS